MSLSCRVFGHRPAFWAEGETLRWRCERGCGVEGSKTYATEADARRYAAALDRRDGEDFGRRAPLSLLPLRLARRRRDKAEAKEAAARSAGSSGG